MRQIDVRKTRKRSDYLPEKPVQDTAVAVGERTKTAYGYRVDGFSGKFETFVDVFMPGACTPTRKHATKSCVVRCLSGTGRIRVEDNLLQLSEGVEQVVPAGTAFRIESAPHDKLEIFVVQEAKFDARVEVLSDGVDAKVVPDSLFSSRKTTDEPKNFTRVGRKPSTPNPEVVGFNPLPAEYIQESAKSTETISYISGGVNAQPIGADAFKDF